MSGDNPHPGVVFHAEPDIIRAFANRSPEEAARFSDEVTRLGNAEGIVPSGAKVPPAAPYKD